MNYGHKTPQEVQTFY